MLRSLDRDDGDDRDGLEARGSWDRSPSRDWDRPRSGDESDRSCRSLSRDREPGGVPARWSAAERLTLPGGRDRQHVSLRQRRFKLRGSESELLATVGAFRVVAERDLAASEPHLSDDVRALRHQGLLESRSVVINQRSEHVLSLTRTGRALLEQHRVAGSDRESAGEPVQVFYAGVVNLRDLAHNAQLYRLFIQERDVLAADGARVTRVALDYELKRDYHQYVEGRVQKGAERTAARREFAAQRDLPFRAGRIELPDVRIEYETPDGERGWRDAELATEHYSRAQVAGKQTAGFRVYRAAGARTFGASARGGSPIDPHHLEWIR